MRSRLRAFRTLIGGVALAATVFSIERASDMLGMAVAYKAKMLCSGVFVAGRQPEDVIAELEIDDLAPLRFIRTYVDPSEGMVTASAVGVVRRRAATRGATGCALVPRGMTRTEFRQKSARDTVALWARQPSPSLPEAAPDDSIRLALAPVLDVAFSEPDSTHRRRTQAIVVVHRGQIVAERYAPGIRPETRLLGWSMTKSVMNAFVGIIVREGHVSVDAPVSLSSLPEPGHVRGTITWDHLLHMSSGLRFDEGMSGLRSDVIRMLLDTDDMAAFAAARGRAVAPGTRWQYSSGTSVLLARAMRSALNDDQAYVRFPREALFDRIGMSSAVIETDAAGTFVGSSLMYASARDWARLGLLYVADGVWNGERILPEGWVAYSGTPASADPHRGYGAHFWLGTPIDPGEPVAPLPSGSLQAAGHEGQFVTIIPTRGVVIVRLGRTRYPEAWDQDAFVRAVLGVLPARDS